MNMLKNEVNKDPTSEIVELLDFVPISFGFINEISKNTNYLFNHYYIIIVKSGEITISSFEKKYTLKGGDLLLISPLMIFSVEKNIIDSEFVYFSFQTSNIIVDKRFKYLFLKSGFSYFPNIVMPWQIDNLSYLNQSVIDNYPGVFILVKCQLTRLMIILINRFNHGTIKQGVKKAKNAKHDLVINIIHYIHNNYNHSLKVKDIASHFHFSENYIYKAFEETLGISCKSFIEDFRIKRSISDLTTTDMPISKIAETYGYPSIYHYSKIFKKTFGTAPSKYRAMKKKSTSGL